MAKLLYISANPKETNNSFGRTIGEELLKEYQGKNPEDSITKINLYDYEMYNLDKDIVNFMSGVISEEELEDMNKKEIIRQKEILEEFMDHDKYIFVIPLWNLGIPPIVKTYFDNISIVGKTFKYTSSGPVGLLKNKKAVLIQASGGIYSKPPMSELEHGISYINSILSFFGVEEIEKLYIEGTNIIEIDKEQIKKEAIQKVKDIVKIF